MHLLKHIRDHPYTFWTLLSLPAIPMIMVLSSGTPEAIHNLLHPTGVFAARFMIFAMMITPLTLLLKGWRGPRWLMKRRRYLGVAAFVYAAAHTCLYLLDGGSNAFTLTEITKLYVWTGWLAFLIFVPLAITSTDGWVRRLGPKWKLLQRFVYCAAILALLHWAALHDWGGTGPAVVHFLPLAILELYRFWAYWFQKRKRTAA